MKSQNDIMTGRLKVLSLISDSLGDSHIPGKDLDPRAAGFDVVVYGHSHQPSLETRDGVLFVNPGSAGPRRFDLPVSVALLEIAGGEPRIELLTLDV